MDPLEVRCPACKAEPGASCLNAKGKAKGPCPARKKLADPTAEYLRRAAVKTRLQQRKADGEHAEAVAKAPLFAGQIEKAAVPTPLENYWRTRQLVAGSPGSGGDERWEPRAGFHEDWKVGVLKRLARETLPPAAYQDFCDKRWMAYPVMFWTRVLTTLEPVVGTYQRISHGWNPSPKKDILGTPVCCGHGCSKCEVPLICYIERVELIPTHCWPPEGWTPPFTSAEIDAVLAVPPPKDHPGAVDPAGLNTEGA